MKKRWLVARLIRRVTLGTSDGIFMIGCVYFRFAQQLLVAVHVLGNLGLWDGGQVWLMHIFWSDWTTVAVFRCEWLLSVSKCADSIGHVLVVDILAQSIHRVIGAIVWNSDLFAEQFGSDFRDVVYFIIIRVISTIVTLEFVGFKIYLVVLKGFLSNLIELLFRNRSSPHETVHNLRFKPLEYHLFAVLVHLPNRVNVRQQAVDGMVFQLVDLALQFLDLHQHLLIFFLLHKFTV